jgi:hypothetical protein
MPMRHSSLKGLALVCILSVACSCATIISGGRQQIEVSSTSERPEAVYVNGEFQDSTPCTIKVKRSLRKEKVLTVGESDTARVIRLDKKFNKVSTLNFVLIPGWIIDLLTGAVVKYRNYEIEE